MDRMIHISGRAMQGIMARQTAVANNMANSDTIGFRAEIVNANARYVEREQTFDSRAVTDEYVLQADMNAGAFMATGRPLDVALNGDALLAVQSPDGSEGYTRRGDLMMSETGLVSTADGHPVLGENGPLTLPDADSVSIAKDGTVWVVPRGGDPDNPVQADRLKLVSPQGSEIVKQNDTLFHVRGGGALPSDPEARLTPETLEKSNVNMSQALVDMIEVSRAWETQVKMLKAAQEMDEQGASIMKIG